MPCLGIGRTARARTCRGGGRSPIGVVIGRHAALPSQFRRASIGGGVLTFSLCGASGPAQDGLPCHPGFFAWIFFLVCMECREVSDIYLEPERALPPGTPLPSATLHGHGRKWISCGSGFKRGRAESLLIAVAFPNPGCD